MPNITVHPVIPGVLLLVVIGSVGYIHHLRQYSARQLRNRQNLIDHQNDRLKTLLQEKEWLLKEVHHRVKNNLQIVISLLNTQSAYLDNEDAIRALRNSQNRMYAMSLIHLKLYQSENMSAIDMGWYIHELVEYMRQTFLLTPRIRFVLETEKMELDIAQAVPVALILNEAVSNAIKYAFADQPIGTITILLKGSAGNCEVTVADDGKGLPPEWSMSTIHSLGINLMHGLSDQLDGNLTLQNNNGLRVCLTFPISANA